MNDFYHGNYTVDRAVSIGRGMKIHDGWSFLLTAVAASHVLLVPYTKVEESFNLQAVHDICHSAGNIAAYDHLDFPGVVPRTFLGAVTAAAPACPAIAVLEQAGYPKSMGLYVTRLVLGGLSIAGLLRLRHAVARRLGPAAGKCFVLISCCQFHLLFYASRPLPNTFALPLVCWAVAEWMLENFERVVCILAFTTLVVRCDLLPFAALTGLALLATGGLKLRRGLAIGARAAALSLTSVLVDSFFWQRWLWPEGSVLWFNTAENRSSEWGTQPLLWYFTSALPRSMLAALPLSVWGLFIERRVRLVILTTLGYIILYSLLPHKELRFLLPVLPVLNIPAAAALASLWRNRLKSPARGLLLLTAALGLLASCALTAFFVAVSRLNYPGGHALAKLHEIHNGPYGATVHIDVLPAMTGVSRFGEWELPWQYSKEEGLQLEDLQLRNFTHLLSAQRAVPGFDMIHAVTGFSHLALKKSVNGLLQSLKSGRLPLEIVVEEQVFIHERAGLML